MQINIQKVFNTDIEVGKTHFTYIPLKCIYNKFPPNNIVVYDSKTTICVSKLKHDFNWYGTNMAWLNYFIDLNGKAEMDFILMNCLINVVVRATEKAHN